MIEEFLLLNNGDVFSQDYEDDPYANLPALLHPNDWSLSSTELESDFESKPDEEWGPGAPPLNAKKKFNASFSARTYFRGVTGSHYEIFYV